MSDFNPTKYKNDYQKNNYDRLVINVPKGQRQVIKDFASKQGQSLNAFVVGLIEQAIKDML